MPCRIDSKERMDNLGTQLKWLCGLFPTIPILVLEADSCQRIFIPKEIYKNVTYLFVEDEDPVFYRTYYLNRMLKTVMTPIAGIWDTDVILSKEQIVDALNAIRNKKVVMSIPYDGRVYAMSSDVSRKFRDTIQFTYLTQNALDVNLILGNQSVGGAVFVNRAIYLDVGGENEHFYGWGPEDMERVYRIKKLSLSFYRSKGALFHLYHPVGLNSQYASSSIERRNQSEFSGIMQMNERELKNYIEVWKNPQKLLPKIVDHLLVHVYESDSIGLFYGKMGIAIFFFHCARFLKSPIYEDFAEDLLDIVSSRLSTDMLWGFAEGVCGIGWGFEYLVQAGFLEGDSLMLLKEFDQKVMEKDLSYLSDTSLETGLKGLYCYVQARIAAARRQNKQIPFTMDYYQMVNEQMRRNNLSHFNADFYFVFVSFLNRVFLEQKSDSWNLGLKDGCAGFGLKWIFS